MTSPIVFISMATQSHHRLVNEWFLPSFKDELPMQITYCDDKLSGGGEWRTPSFDSAVQRKMKVIADAVAENQGKLLVWTDVDIQFFRPISDALIQLMQQSDSDMMFQRGHHRMQEVCTGLFVTRCTKKNLVLLANYTVVDADLFLSR